MKEKIKDILEKHYYGRNFIEDKCADELFELFVNSNPNADWEATLKAESECVIHSTDWGRKCFVCGVQVFIRDPK